MYWFIHFPESATVHHHRAGHRHGGQPELRPLQHGHRHHLRQGHQRQPAHADLQDGELTHTPRAAPLSSRRRELRGRDATGWRCRGSGREEPRSHQPRFTAGQARVVESKGRPLAPLCEMLLHTYTHTHSHSHMRANPYHWRWWTWNESQRVCNDRWPDSDI